MAEMLAAEHIPEAKAMRDAYCEALTACADANEWILDVEADIMNSMGTAAFSRKYPERTVNCGIQEANAVGVSAGLSVVGYIPFFHTFSVFASRRAFDQVFLSCAYAKANVKIVGADAGVTAAMNGGTHMPFEDMGIMRNIPGMTVIEPADSTALKCFVPQMAENYGNFYMRINRKNAVKIYRDDARLKIGRAAVLKEGTDVAIIANGIMVAEALKAGEILWDKGFGARIVDMHTLKPIDAACVLESARLTGAIVTAENHNIINGLGSAVAEVLSENMPAPLERVGVLDEFGEVGDTETLMKRFGLTAGVIAEKALKVIERKAR
jgi:transketolase